MTTSATTLFDATPDPAYDISRSKVPLDVSTDYRSLTIVSPSSGAATGTIAAPINAVGQTSAFQVAIGSNARVKWDTSAIRFRMLFHTVGGAALTAANGIPYHSPPPLMWAHMIDSIRVTFNDASDAVFQASGRDTYAQGLLMNIFRTMSHEAMNQHSDAFFTPFNSEASGYAMRDNAAAVTWLASGTHPDQVLRSLWIPASNTATVDKIVPFHILFPRMPPAILANLSKFRIEITWDSRTDLVEHIHDVDAAGGQGVPATETCRVSLVACDLLLDQYILSAAQQAATVSDKLAGKSDIVSYINWEVVPHAYVSGSTMSFGKKNIESVYCFAPMFGLANGAGGGAARTNTGLDDLCWPGCHTAAAGPLNIRDCTNAVTSIHFGYGSQMYPGTPVNTISGGVYQPMQLYHMYLLATGKSGRREVSAAANYGMMAGTYPFACFKPWADAPGVHTSDQRDVTINIVSSATAAGGPTLAVVFFYLTVVEIHHDGSITILK